MIRKSILPKLVMAGVLAGVAGVAGAQLAITAPVTEGTGVTVSGTGTVPLGAVELWVNGESAGSVQADGAGAWSIVADLVQGDDIYVTASQVWDFKDANEYSATADPLKWFPGGDDTSSVDTNGDGVMTITNSATDTNMTLALGDDSAPVGIYNNNQTRVIEIRYRITSSSFDHVTAGGQAAFYSDGTDFENFGTQSTFTNAGVGQWNTTLISATLDGFDLVSVPNTNNWLTETASQLVFGANGFSTGDTIEIDFVRLHEYYEFDFDDDGDTMGLIPGSATTTPSVTSSVTSVGGELVITAGGAGTAAVDLESFSFIDSPYYNVIETVVAVDLPFAGGAGFNVGYYSWSGTYNGSGWPIQLYANDGSPTNTFQISPATSASFGIDWATNPVLLDGFPGTPQSTDYDFLQAFFPSAAGESIRFDYIRFRPGPISGPSATETVQASSSVDDWMILQ